MGPKSKESKVEQRLVSIDDSWWVQLGAKTAFQLGGDCDRQATPKPPASQEVGMCSLVFLLCCSCVALVLLLCSSCFSLGRRWGPEPHCGVSTAPMPNFDGSSSAVIQMKLEYWKLNKAAAAGNRDP